MKKDFKTGMLIGLLIVIACVIWLSTRPRLSTEMLLTRAAHTPEPLEQQGLTSVALDSQAARSGGQSHDASPVTASGGNSTTSGQSKSPPSKSKQTTSSQKVRMHIVREDETLSDIARTYYGSPAKWRTIYKANKDTIGNPDKVSPGTKLIIP